MAETTDIPKEPDQEPSVKFGARPFEIPVLPLQKTTLFPETMVPLAVGRPASVAAVEASLASEEKLIACVSVRPDKTSEDDAKPDELFEVGTLVMIKRMERVEETLHLIVQGTDRIQVLAWTQNEPFLKARVQILPDLITTNKEEVEIIRLRSKIASEAQTEMDKAQRDYVLRQQMKAIQKELGEGEAGEAAEAEQLRERLAKLDLPDDVRKEAERELGRMEKLPAM